MGVCSIYCTVCYVLYHLLHEQIDGGLIKEGLVGQSNVAHLIIGLVDSHDQHMMARENVQAS
jgi:hypothetical protein